MTRILSKRFVFAWQGLPHVAEISLSGEICPKTGMLINFTDLDSFWNRAVVKPAQQIQDLPALETRCRWIWEQLHPVVSQAGFSLTNIKLSVTDTWYVEYSGVL